MFRLFNKFKKQPEPVVEIQTEMPQQEEVYGARHEEAEPNYKEQMAEIDAKLASMDTYTERRAYIDEKVRNNGPLAYQKMERQGMDFHESRTMNTAADIVDGSERMDLANHIHELDRNLHTHMPYQPETTLAVTVPGKDGVITCSYNTDEARLNIGVLADKSQLPEDTIIIEDSKDQELATALSDARSFTGSVVPKEREHGETFDAVYCTLNGEMSPEQFQEFAQEHQKAAMTEKSKEALRAQHRKAVEAEHSTEAPEVTPDMEPEL